MSQAARDHCHKRRVVGQVTVLSQVLTPTTDLFTSVSRRWRPFDHSRGGPERKLQRCSPPWRTDPVWRCIYSNSMDGQPVSFPVKRTVRKETGRPLDCLGRNVSGGTRPRLSWGRSPL